MRAINADGIEAAIGRLRVVLLLIRERRFADFLPLGGADTGGGTDLRPRLATAHLDENQLRAIAGDEVNLAITGAKVVRYNDEPRAFR